MKTYLVVLDKPIAAQSLRFGLLDLVSRRKPAQLVLLQTTQRLPSETAEEARQFAYASVLSTQSGLITMGLPIVDARVGDALPKKAIAQEVRQGEHHYDGIVLTSKTSGLQRWLHFDLARQLERKFGLPVSYVQVAPAERVVVA